MPYCSSDTFQLYLDLFAEQNPSEFKIIVLDNGAFHKAKKLKIPKNMAILFLPPYSPELNPAEKVWQHIKRKFTNQYFKDLNQISDFFKTTLSVISKENVKSICSYSYLSLQSFWSI